MKKPDLNNIREKAVETAGKAANAAKNAGGKFVERAGKAKDDLAVWRNKPITLKEIKAKEYQLPELLHVVDNDVRFNDPLFENAIAFQDNVKSVSALLVLTKNAGKKMGLKLDPVADEGVYMQDPFKPQRYIAVNDYFEYMQQEKVDELAEFAQKLGAKHIKITLNEEKKVFAKQNKSAKAKVKKHEVLPKEKGEKKAKETDTYIEIGGEAATEDKEYRLVDVLTEMNFPGGEPQEPEINIFRNQKMKALVRMRMDKENRLIGKYVVKMKYMTSAEYSKTKALSIDAALKKWNLGVGGDVNATTSEEIQASNRLEVVYQIEFPQ